MEIFNLTYERSYLNILHEGLGSLFAGKEGMPIAEETRLNRIRSCPTPGRERRNYTQVGLTAGLGLLFNRHELHKKTLYLSFIGMALIASTAFASDTDWLEEGQRYQKSGNYSEAIVCFEKAVEEKPDNVRAWNHLAVCYFWNGHAEKAVEVSKLAVEKWPTNLVVVNNYAFMAGCRAEWDFEKYTDGEMSKKDYVVTLNEAITASQTAIDVFNMKPEGFNYSFCDVNHNTKISLDERKEQIENEIFR